MSVATDPRFDGLPVAVQAPHDAARDWADLSGRWGQQHSAMPEALRVERAEAEAEMDRLTPLQSLMLGKDPGAKGDIAEAYRLGRNAALECVKTTAALPLQGCGDHSCVVRRPDGMGTNGGCQCSERQLRRAVRVLTARLDAVDLGQA